MVCLLPQLLPSWMLSKIRLCDVRFTTVAANIDLKSVTVNSRTGDFNPSSLAQIINTDTLNTLVVQTWLDRAGYFLAVVFLTVSSRNV